MVGRRSGTLQRIVALAHGLQLLLEQSKSVGMHEDSFVSSPIVMTCMTDGEAPAKQEGTGSFCTRRRGRA
jgi:hypothetical protein